MGCLKKCKIKSIPTSPGTTTPLRTTNQYPPLMFDWTWTGCGCGNKTPLLCFGGIKGRPLSVRNASKLHIWVQCCTILWSEKETALPLWFKYAVFHLIFKYAIHSFQYNNIFTIYTLYYKGKKAMFKYFVDLSCLSSLIFRVANYSPTVLKMGYCAVPFHLNGTLHSWVTVK